VQADAFNLPPELHGHFDVAMSYGTVEHYRYPRRPAICQAHIDLVRPGGAVIISVPIVLFLASEVLKRLLVARDGYVPALALTFWRASRIC
jgi:2-polyprenyl-3-methyl-5-hydroxy-6-metoxy-1,4-benzoquinol methylase|tara:strand:+ start:58 stop:330 length:273 start_codon:yes stop_codon:yes gene_type:complete